MSSVSSSSSDCEDETIYNPTIGIILIIIVCLCYAFGNNLQRFALTKEKHEKIFSLNRDIVWMIGIAIYFGGNLLYSVAISFAPATLLASVFALTIVFNAGCARIMNGDKIKSTISYVGYALILFGVPAVSASLIVPVVHYDAMELKVIMTTPGALSFWIIGSLIIISGLFFVYKIEKEYPNSTVATDGSDNSTGNRESEKKEQKNKDVEFTDEEQATNGVVESDQKQKKPSSEDDRVMHPMKKITPAKILSPKMHLIAKIIYPATLGFIEAFGTALLKGINSLLTVAYSEAGCEEDTIAETTTDVATDDNDSLALIMLGLMGSAGFVLVILIVLMLRLTFGRFEITSAFPIEFGSLTCVSLVWAFLVFQDYQYIEDVSTTLWILFGALSILSGISLCAYGSR